jgi:hypothetical protein
MPVRCNRRILLASSSYAPHRQPRLCCHMPDITFPPLRTRHPNLGSCRPHLSSLIIIHLGRADIPTSAASPLCSRNPNLFRSTVPSMHRFAPPRTYCHSLDLVFPNNIILPIRHTLHLTSSIVTCASQPHCHLPWSPVILPTSLNTCF